MKICVIGLRGFPQIQGGVEKHCEALYPLMKKRKDIKLIVFRRKPYINLKNCEKTYQNIGFIDVPCTTLKGLETFSYSLKSTIAAIKIRPDIIHYHNIGPAAFGFLPKVFGIKIVLTYHSANYEHEKWGFFAKKLLRISEKMALLFADRVIFVNRFQMERFETKVRNKSYYIPNGINKPYFSSKVDFLEKNALEPGKYVLAVGRITPEKGFDTLIRAFQMADIKGYKLAIAGGVEHEQKYFEKLKRLGGDVVFTGIAQKEELAQLYSHASLFVLASNNEGFPIVLLEAMNYGLKVIVSDIPATHLVELDEKNYFEKQNENELSRKIKENILGAPNMMKFSYSLEEFDWEAIEKHVEEIYDALVSS